MNNTGYAYQIPATKKLTLRTPHMAITKVDVEPKVTTPVVVTTPTMPVRPRRQYTHSTLFEGNGKKLLWDGLGTKVGLANSAMEVCNIAGLNYEVRTEDIFTSDGIKIPNMKATRRYDIEGDVEIPSTVFGVVSKRYVPIQNPIGFELIDLLFRHEGFEVETAGQFDDGKIVWIEARMPMREIAGEKIDPYLVFTNRHDGKGSVRIFLTPVRVVCRNTLNMAIHGAQNRSFSVQHTASANVKLAQARQTIENYNRYLDAMEAKIAQQKRVLLTDKHVDDFLNQLFVTNDDMNPREYERVVQSREDVRRIYRNEPDLDGYEYSGFRFINAVSDWATHHTPSRQTRNYRDNLFQKTLAGNEFIDKAVEIVDSFATEVL